MVVHCGSTSIYYTALRRNLVTWRSKKQNVVVRSSAKVEFKATTQGICELLWQKIILGDLKVKWKGTIKLHSNNKSTINIAHNPIQRDCEKYV